MGDSQGAENEGGTTGTHLIYDSDIGKPPDNLVVRKCSCFLLNMGDLSEELLPHEQTR